MNAEMLKIWEGTEGVVNKIDEQPKCCEAIRLLLTEGLKQWDKATVKVLGHALVNHKKAVCAE